jgi:hypothetical protein
MRPNLDPTLISAAAVDAGNAHARGNGRKPDAIGPWPSESWAPADWVIYRRVLLKLWRVYEPSIAQAMEADFTRTQQAY